MLLGLVSSTKKCGCSCSSCSGLILGSNASLDPAILDRTLKNTCLLNRLTEKVEDLCEKIEDLPDEPIGGGNGGESGDESEPDPVEPNPDPPANPGRCFILAESLIYTGTGNSEKSGFLGLTNNGNPGFWPQIWQANLFAFVQDGNGDLRIVSDAPASD